MAKPLTLEQLHANLAAVTEMVRELQRREDNAANVMRTLTADDLGTDRALVVMQTKQAATLACYAAVHAKMLLMFACSTLVFPDHCAPKENA